MAYRTSAGGLELLDPRGLLVGQDLGEDRVDRKLARDGLRDRVRVSGQHGHLDAELVQPADGFRRLRPDGIRDGEGGQHAITLE